MSWTRRSVKYEDPEILEFDDDWGRRRANMRHEVSVPGVLTDRLGLRVRCEIEDVSASGMALAVEMITDHPGRDPLAQGMPVTLEFTPDPEGAPDHSVSVAVRVMWRAPVAVGVHFEESTPELRAALRRIAEPAVTARVDDSLRNRHELTAEQRAILQACRKTVQKQLPNLLWVMRTQLVKRLRTAATEAHGAEAEAALAEAELIDDKAMAITRTIEHQFLQGFGAASDLEQTQELTMMQLRAAKNERENADLDVVEDDAAEHGSRITALAHTIEERFKSKFFELNVRIANVVGHPLDTNANPLVPGTACRILWHAVTGYCDSPRVEHLLKQTMVQHVMPLLGELYEAINTTLDEHGAKRILDVRQDDATRRS